MQQKHLKKTDFWRNCIINKKYKNRNNTIVSKIYAFQHNWILIRLLKPSFQSKMDTLIFSGSRAYTDIK